jgi:hypothetical protein
MGYNLHIRRIQGMSPIALEDWLEYIAHDPELWLIENLEITSSEGSTISLNGKGIARWNTMNNGKEYRVSFIYRNGRISAAYLDDFQITKMKEIASKLDAVIVGDEGEEY